ncbi:MAG: type II toxin-antitoxin system VapC family toxin [Bacteroidales bacterium]|nr:type II toxin-antitoxin system VapC family toxin [Bacteroidales bacterium]MCF8351057.1 type II toxin-antitoxin system VapC family toxin [Bacteroidales bacterium]MCF8375877.1 type II toxin-antitoxin system VapC family toxin [Bacteroidales bacterium]
MNGIDKLLDSNILIYLSKKLLKLSSFSKPGDRILISVITYMEVLGYPFKTKKEEKLVKSICDSLEVIYLDQNIVHEVIRIRKSAKIKLPDAIIAASAIVNHSELITRNTKDFEIPGSQLKLFNPFDN